MNMTAMILMNVVKTSMMAVITIVITTLAHITALVILDTG
jgi:hypothetical protein